jgi:hypothetical protein
MDPNPDREVFISLRFMTVPVPADGLAAVPCLNCQRPLEIHQPDSDLPDRMLATCEECKCWYLIESNPEGTEAVVVLLPPAEPFRDAPED